ncbi:WD40 repeat-like protein [Cylindrobasidium torrendii FP15055 ss-10]|uniref:WD40 repeat-like protein n=1 Tax=Cylindrobasidium torrendii FP15055 ss-10 TaxID=1314674 RepID=A0A0D7ASL9_9AGAR|nr:WD40 repeat-like protein [Cylindrobasidium torrendii FP15055 ss-10]
MSFKQTYLFPANPATTRGVATKISSSKDKVVYANGKAIIIRDLANPEQSYAYVGHVQNTTVARISPSGYYCASADAVGNVRVWDTVGEDHVLKGEYKVISGKINDLEWDGESKRIIAVGDGREKFGHAFTMDTGNSTGEISGHSKPVNAVSLRHQRPFRAATAADDNLIVFHQGAPYKYDKTIRTHTKYIQDVRYAPSGDHFASVGSDAKVFLYDGKEGEMVAEFNDSPHTGTVMACSWSADSKSLATSSADRTVKLWDVETRKCTTTWSIGSGLDQQQMGNTWTSTAGIVSLSLSGDLNVLDPRVADKPVKVYSAPQKAVTAITPTKDDATFLVGCADGRVLSYDITKGESTSVSGDGHSSLVTSLAVASNGTVFSAGFDDKIREIQESFTPASLSTGSQPKSIAVADDSAVFVAEINGIEVIRNNQKITEFKSKFTPSSVAVNGSIVAVGGEHQKVQLFEWNGTTLKESDVLEGNKGVVSALSFSPDGKYLTAGDSSGRIVLFDVQEKKMVTGRWSFHSARVNSLSWTPDSKHCVSGSLDTHVYIWSVEKPMKNIALKNVCLGGVNSVLFVIPTRVVAAGADGCARVFEITFHA